MVCRVGDWAQAWVVGWRCSPLMRDIGWLGAGPARCALAAAPERHLPVPTPDRRPGRGRVYRSIRRLPLARVPYRPTWPDRVAGIRFCPGRQGATR